MPDNLAQLPLTLCLSKATVAAGTTTTLVNTGTTTFMVRNKLYTKAAMSNVATPVLDATTGLAFVPVGILKGSVYVICFTAGGALAVAQGSIVDLDGAGAFTLGPQFPSIKVETMCPIAYLLVKLGPTAVAAWTFGANNNSSVTGVTYTFVDIAQIPDRPQIS